MNDNKNNSDCQTVVFSVYVLWCSKTDMHYVGVTSKKITARIRQHRRGKRQFLDREIQKIGWENFDWWVVEEGIPSELISECEKKWVKCFDCVHPKGYNRTTGGIKFFKHTEECKDKMSAKSTGENNPNFGKPMPEETKAKMREKALERDMSGERNPHYGKKHTEEAKEIMRQARLGKPSWNKGIPCSEEQKAVLREKALARDTSGEKNPFYGRKHTEKTRAILREKALARWAAKRAAKAAEEAAKNSST